MGSLELPYFAVEKHSSFFSFAQTFSPSQDLFSHWPTQPDSTHQPDPLLKFSPSLTGEFQHVLRLLFQPLNLLAASASPELFICCSDTSPGRFHALAVAETSGESVGGSRSLTHAFLTIPGTGYAGWGFFITHACVCVVPRVSLCEGSRQRVLVNAR